jgi:hypothetical protein
MDFERCWITNVQATVMAASTWRGEDTTITENIVPIAQWINRGDGHFLIHSI